MFQPTEIKIDHDRFYYEPRALWSSARVSTLLQPATQSHPAGYAQLPKEDFKNPSRYPIRITHAVVSPLGYLFRSFIAGVIPPFPTFDQAMAGIGRMRMAIAFPKRSWIERMNTDVMSFASVASGEPSLDDDALLDYASGLFGISRWKFDVPYMVPRKASIEIILSTIGAYNTINQVNVPASVVVHERGGRMLGHARSRVAAPLEYAPSIGVQQPWPASRFPIVPDFFALNAAANGPQGQTFPPSAKWPSSDYNKQLASRGLPYTELEGFAVSIDQIAFDDLAALTGLGGAQQRIAPISQRIITKASTRDAGTGEQWWRDGAPLSLVTPTMTPGFVHRFAQPFELGPGEGLEVTLQAPPPRAVGVTPNLQSAYNVGVSFCGYAVVEDNNHKVYR